MRRYDVVAIGGGFYGSFLSGQLAQWYPSHTFALLEKEDRLFTRAAASNQGQLHLGYLYASNPRLAQDCVRTASLFDRHFRDTIDHDVTTYYGIHRDSAVSPTQYEQFCAQVRLPLRRPDDLPPDLFSEQIVAAYRTPEKTFNSARLQAALRAQLDRARVDVLTGHSVRRIEPIGPSGYRLCLDDGESIVARVVFNTTFADINTLHENSGIPLIPTRYDVLLDFLVALPPAYDKVGGAAVVGPYAVLAPSSFQGAHILASGRHRTVAAGIDHPPTETIDEQVVHDRYQKAIEEGQQGIPALREAEYRGYTLGTSVKPRNPGTGAVTPQGVVSLDHAGLTGYHVIVAGQVSAMFDTLEPARRAVARPGVRPAVASAA